MRKKYKMSIKKLLNKETLLYAFFGIITAIENIALFRLLALTMEYKVANVITVIIVKLTAYVCNKNFVFKSKTENYYDLLKEFLRFLIARSSTMIIDYFGLICAVELLNFDMFYSKCFFAVIVIIINYFIGKKHVFKDNVDISK